MARQYAHFIVGRQTVQLREGNAAAFLDLMKEYICGTRAEQTLLTARKEMESMFETPSDALHFQLAISAAKSLPGRRRFYVFNDCLVASLIEDRQRVLSTGLYFEVCRVSTSDYSPF